MSSASASIAQHWQRPARRAGCSVLALALIAVAGCGGPPQIGPGNYRLAAGLRTAISARNSDWLDSSAEVIAERRKSGELNEEQATALEAIIQQARDGDWAGAETEIVRLAKAQHDTPN